MTLPWPALASVLLVSLVSLVGLTALAMGAARTRRLTGLLVSFAVGGLLGDAFIHLVPEALAPAPGRGALGGSLLVLAGLLAFFIVEKLLRRRPPRSRAEDVAEVPLPRALAAVNLLGDAIHNFIDGLLIGGSWLAGPAVGMATTLAVLLHEVPQELGDFGILLHAGLAPRQAVRLNLASGSVAILGTVVALAAGAVARERVVALLLPVAAGGFVYIAAADLIPELQRDRTLRGLIVQTALIALGIALMSLLTLLE